MQTFLPYCSFIESAKCLDYKRLGKQRVEALQIYNILVGNSKSNAWKNHPAVKMWEGYTEALAQYYNIILNEWIFRGYNNTMKELPIISNTIFPWWLGNPNFHRSVRAKLIQKNRDFYFGQWKEDERFNNSNYLWPDSITKTFKVINKN